MIPVRLPGSVEEGGRCFFDIPSIGQTGCVACLDYNGDGSIASRPDFRAAQAREGVHFTGFTRTIFRE